MKKKYIDLDLAKDSINSCVKDVDESDKSPSYKQSIKTAAYWYMKLLDLLPYEVKTAHEWISVKDKLPPPGKKVIVKCKAEDNFGDPYTYKTYAIYIPANTNIDDVYWYEGKSKVFVLINDSHTYLHGNKTYVKTGWYEASVNVYSWDGASKVFGKVLCWKEDIDD